MSSRDGGDVRKPTHIGDVLRQMGAVPPDEKASNVRPLRNEPTVEVSYILGDDLDLDAWADNYIRLVMQMDEEQRLSIPATREAS